MLDGIRPPDFWTHLQAVLPQLDGEAHGEMRTLGSQALDGSAFPECNAPDVLQKLLEQAVFRPGVPLQVLGHPATPASEGVTCLGPVGSATMARRLAARHYSLLEARSGNAGAFRKRLRHLTQQVLVFLQLAPVQQHSAHLPGGYVPIPRPSKTMLPPNRMRGGQP